MPPAPPAGGSWRVVRGAFVPIILHTCIQSFTVWFLVERVQASLALAGRRVAVLRAAG